MQQHHPRQLNLLVTKYNQHCLKLVGSDLRNILYNYFALIQKSISLVGIVRSERCLRWQTLLLDIARSDSAWSRWYKIQPDSVHIFPRRDGMFQENKGCKMLAMLPADRIPRDTRGMQLPSRLNPGTVQWHTPRREFPLLRRDIFRSGCSRVRGCSHQRRSSCSSAGCLCW